MKRFYKEAGIQESEDGFRVLLDGRPVRTPAHNMLSLPTRALAEAIAEEWRAQGDKILPVSMPFLRLADTVIDGVAANREDVIDAILRLGENDHLCYRAHQPPELAELQRDSWDPILDWARTRFGATLLVASGLSHVDQPPQALATLRRALEQYDVFSLAGLHVIATITGSLLLALALSEGEATPARVFALSRIDEDYQAGKWGRDHEAEVRATNLAHEIDKASEFIAAARQKT